MVPLILGSPKCEPKCSPGKALDAGRLRSKSSGGAGVAAFVPGCASSFPSQASWSLWKMCFALDARL